MNDADDQLNIQEAVSLMVKKHGLSHTTAASIWMTLELARLEKAVKQLNKQMKTLR